MPKNTIYNFIS